MRYFIFDGLYKGLNGGEMPGGTKPLFSLNGCWSGMLVRGESRSPEKCCFNLRALKT